MSDMGIRMSFRLRFSALTAFAVLFLVAMPLHAKRLALIIGNDNYARVSKLQKAGNDAVAMATELRAAGFEVSLYRDLDYRGMVKATEALYSSIQGGDEVVVFFAGHGVQIRSGNYLLPIDIEATTESAVEKTSYALNDLTERLESARAAFSLVLVDACRDNPLKPNGRSIGNSRGLSPPDPPIGQMIVYSASRGEQALDRLNDDDMNPNSVFTREFIARMRKPGVKVDELVRQIQISVEALAAGIGHKQRPAFYNEARGNFYFYGPTTILLSDGAAARGSDDALREDRFWEDTKSAGNRDGFEAYLEQYPKGRYASLARANIIRLTGGIDMSSPKPTPPRDVSSGKVSNQAPQPAVAPVPGTPNAGAALASPTASTLPTPESSSSTAQGAMPTQKRSVRLTLPNGDRYEGEVVGTHREGVGSYLFANGDRYDGEFADDHFHGKGTQTFASGDVFTGEFVRGTKTGQAVYKFANGSRFEGQMQDNKFNGLGMMAFKSGELYEGQFVSNAPLGKGSYRFANGDRFEGNFVGTLMSGTGVMVFASGDRYEGDVVNGVKHGQGTHFFANKERYVGGFVAGLQAGVGTHYFSNGDRYQGGFANGVRHGKGTYHFANGETLEKNFVNGVEAN